METKELRIGNLVIDYENGNVIQITTGKQIDRPELMGLIPLTEEWLLKFGFTNGDGVRAKGLYWIKIIGNLEISISPVNGIVFLSQTNSSDDVKLNRRITFVHLLQNLYFDLTGEELNASTITHPLKDHKPKPPKEY